MIIGVNRIKIIFSENQVKVLFIYSCTKWYIHNDKLRHYEGVIAGAVELKVWGVVMDS